MAQDLKRVSARTAALAVAAATILALIYPTPHDPGSGASCGSLLTGGFLGLDGGCEQTRGVFRGVVVVGTVLAILIFAGATSRGRWRLAIIVVAGLLTALMVELSFEVFATEPLTYRWVGIFPSAIAASSAAGLWILWRDRSRS